MFSGSFVALVTPMHPNGDVDYRALELLIAWHLSNDTDGFLILGTTGEAPTITAAEREKIIQFTLSLVAKKKPVVIGAGTNCTAHTIELTQQAHALGADAALLIAPYYNKPTQEGLYQHYAAVAKAVPIAQIVYNCPTRTACDILPETLIRLKPYKNIVAVKESVLDLARYKAILQETNLKLLSSNDCDALELFLAGGHGVFSVAANVIPKAFSEFCRAALMGNLARARELDAQYQPLYAALFVESNPIPVKWVLHDMKMIEQGVRLPLTWLSESYQQHVKTVLQSRGIV